MPEEAKGVSQEDIYHRLGTLEGKLDALIGKMTDFSRDIDTCFTRIRVLEANLNKAIGVAILIGIVMPFALDVLSNNARIHFQPESTNKEQVR
jgi:DNA-binding FrmR family transcriptional regulator